MKFSQAMLETSVSSLLNYIGLNQAEIDVYRATFDVGSKPASFIAQKANLKRGHTYNVLGTLIEKGIVQEFVKNNVRHFVCSPPKSLLAVIEERERELSVQKKQLNELLPLLEQKRKPLSNKPVVRFFKGTAGVQAIFEEMLEMAENQIDSVVDFEFSWSFGDESLQRWMESYALRREKKGIWWNGILAKSAEADEVLRRRSDAMRAVKQLDGISIPVQFHLYGSKIAIICIHEQTNGVVIEHSYIAEALQNMFKSVWCFLPDYKLNT